MARWQLREGYFKNPGTYKLGPENGPQVEFTVDQRGIFELDPPPDLPISIFAKHVDG